VRRAAGALLGRRVHAPSLGRLSISSDMTHDTPPTPSCLALFLHVPYTARAPLLFS
jgi:hypothetical protein